MDAQTNNEAHERQHISNDNPSFPSPLGQGLDADRRDKETDISDTCKQWRDLTYAQPNHEASSKPCCHHVIHVNERHGNIWGSGPCLIGVLGANLKDNPYKK